MDIISFDLDGTLVDTAAEIAEAVNRTLGDFAIARRPLPEIEALIGDGAHALMRRLVARIAEEGDAAARAADVNAVLDCLDGHYGQTAGTTSQPYPGCRATLDRLLAGGVRVVCVTNKELAHARRVLEATGLADAFELIIGGDSLPWKKPHAGVLKHVLDELQVPGSARRPCRRFSDRCRGGAQCGRRGVGGAVGATTRAGASKTPSRRGFSTACPDCRSRPRAARAFPHNPAPEPTRRTPMALTALRQVLDHAAEHGYGVPAFNINNMEQGLAIMEARRRPAMRRSFMQASRGARAYANEHHAGEDDRCAGVEMYPQIPLCLHLDHGNEEATCATAIRYGFTSVMMDGSLKCRCQDTRRAMTTMST
jgi:phosphoglycolate phosphatase